MPSLTSSCSLSFFTCHLPKPVKMANRRNAVFVDLREDDKRECEEELHRIVDLTQEDSDNMAPVLRQQGQHYYGPRRLRTQRNPLLNITH